MYKSNWQVFGFNLLEVFEHLTIAFELIIIASQFLKNLFQGFCAETLELE